MTDDDPETLCDLCHRAIAPHAGYVVKIEVYADPSTPPLDAGDASADPTAALQDLLEQVKGMSARELQNGVYRRFTFALCAACQRRYLENPLPRD